MDTRPHYCPHCRTPEACGFHGVLVFGDEPPPMCDHNKKPKPCHEEPVRMVPSRPEVKREA